MKRGTLPLCAGALALGLAAIAPVAAAAEIKTWTGDATPKLQLRDVRGRSVDLARLRGRVVLINFWATWCEPCREEMPSLTRLRSKLDPRRFELLTINYGESPAAVEGFLSNLGVALPVLLDPYKNAAEQWKVKGLPMTFLVDASGKVRYWSFGEQDWSAGEALATVERLVGEARGG
jgi:thiol-disulfide isomerase/thioredoxin